MAQTRITFICLLLLLSFISVSQANEPRPTPDQYWQQIRLIASGEFTGLDVNPVLTTGYQFSGDNQGPNVGIEIDLPLWDKQRRFKKREMAVVFLQKGATLVRELETAINTLGLLNEKTRFLKAIMQNNGVESVEAFFNAQQDIIKYKGLVTQYHRELQGLIRPMSDSVTINSTPVVVAHGQ
jgi:hypothetical protein